MDDGGEGERRRRKVDGEEAPKAPAPSSNDLSAGSRSGRHRRNGPSTTVFLVS